MYNRRNLRLSIFKNDLLLNKINSPFSKYVAPVRPFKTNRISITEYDTLYSILFKFYIIV